MLPIRSLSEFYLELPKLWTSRAQFGRGIYAASAASVKRVVAYLEERFLVAAPACGGQAPRNDGVGSHLVLSAIAVIRSRFW
jgi:hypothetical protein